MAGERSSHAWLPQLTFAVEMGDVEAPNPHTVEAKRTAKWPPRGLATEHKRGPDQLPREVLYEDALRHAERCLS